MFFRRISLALFFTLTLALHALAASDECNDSEDQLRSAREEFRRVQSYVADYNKKYLSCVNLSGGQDDCSYEFRRVKSEQSDLEMAVSAYESALSSYETECHR